MNAYLNLLKSSWHVLGDRARRRVAVYFGITIAADLVSLLVLVLLQLGIVVIQPIDPGSDAMGIVLGLAFLVPLLSLVVTLVLVVIAYTGVKRDYFERCFPGETYVEQNHWKRSDAFTLYFGLVGGASFVSNVLQIVCTLLVPGSFELTDLVAPIAWILLAWRFVPACCKRFCAPAGSAGELRA